MVAGHDVVAALAAEVHRLLGVAAVTDEVARAQVDVDVLLVVRLEDRLEGVDVSVDVAENRVAHWPYL